VDIEGQNMEASVGEKRLLVFYSELKGGKKNVYIEVYIQQSRGGIG
jgi:hypothetical protein